MYLLKYAGKMLVLLKHSDMRSSFGNSKPAIALVDEDYHMSTFRQKVGGKSFALAPNLCLAALLCLC